MQCQVTNKESANLKQIDLRRQKLLFNSKGQVGHFENDTFWPFCYIRGTIPLSYPDYEAGAKRLLF